MGFAGKMIFVFRGFLLLPQLNVPLENFQKVGESGWPEAKVRSTGAGRASSNFSSLRLWWNWQTRYFEVETTTFFCDSSFFFGVTLNSIPINVYKVFIAFLRFVILRRFSSSMQRFCNKVGTTVGTEYERHRSDSRVRYPLDFRSRNRFQLHRYEVAGKSTS